MPIEGVTQNTMGMEMKMLQDAGSEKGDLQIDGKKTEDTKQIQGNKTEKAQEAKQKLFGDAEVKPAKTPSRFLSMLKYIGIGAALLGCLCGGPFMALAAAGIGLAVTSQLLDSGLSKLKLEDFKEEPSGPKADILKNRLHADKEENSEKTDILKDRLHADMEANEKAVKKEESEKLPTMLFEQGKDDSVPKSSVMNGNASPDDYITGLGLDPKKMADLNADQKTSLKNNFKEYLKKNNIDVNSLEEGVLDGIYDSQLEYIRKQAVRQREKEEANEKAIQDYTSNVNVAKEYKEPELKKYNGNLADIGANTVFEQGKNMCYMNAFFNACMRTEGGRDYFKDLVQNELPKMKKTNQKTEQELKRSDFSQLEKTFIQYFPKAINFGTMQESSELVKKFLERAYIAEGTDTLDFFLNSTKDQNKVAKGLQHALEDKHLIIVHTGDKDGGHFRSLEAVSMDQDGHLQLHCRDSMGGKMETLNYNERNPRFEIYTLPEGFRK